MHSMVEGHARLLKTSALRNSRACPSTRDCVGGPPPRSGEDHYAAFTGVR